MEPTKRSFSILPDTEKRALSRSFQTMFKAKVKKKDKQQDERYGVMYLVNDKKTNSKKAVRTIEKSVMNDVNEINLLHAEARIHLDLKHNNIITMYRAFEDTKHFYMVFEPLEAENILSVVEKWRGLSQLTLIKALKQVSSALVYIHGKNIFHRDIKPQNVLVANLGSKVRVKLANFNMSVKSVKPLKTKCGSLPFVAPEVLQQKEYSTKIDIWGLGVTFYVLLSGKSPFDQEMDDEYDVIEQIIQEPVEWSQDVLDNVDEEFQEQVELMLLKEDQARSTATEVLEWASKDRFFKNKGRLAYVADNLRYQKEHRWINDLSKGTKVVDRTLRLAEEVL